MFKTGFLRNGFLIIPIFFLLCSAPGALDYVFHYPDEKYYTDAVLLMQEKGDVYTPYQFNGEPRFKKPIVTYWVLMFSYKLFGVSRISSRIFFWLAGGLLVLITFLMAKSVSGNRKTATLAAAVVAANPLVLISASRSIPDILLALFLTISAWGFFEILLAQKPKKLYFWMAYLGAALAFETKGIPAVAFAGISILFLLFNPWEKKKLSQLVEPVSLLASILVAVGWFAIMYFRHGLAFFQYFIDDQVGVRLASKVVQVVSSGLIGIVNLLAFLVPWLIIAFSKPKAIKDFVTNSPLKTKAVFGLILSWVFLIIFMSGALSKFYDRYLLPVIPVLALFFAYIFSNTETRFTKPILKIFLILNLILLFINSWYTIVIYVHPVLLAAIVISTLLIAAYYFGVFRDINSKTILAASIMLLYFNGFSLLYPLVMPNNGKQLVENLNKEGVAANEKIYVYGNVRAASNIRIHSGNSLEVVSMDTVFALPAEANHYIVFSGKEEPKLNLTDYLVLPGSEEWKNVPAEKFPAFIQKPVAELKANGKKYYIGKPKH